MVVDTLKNIELYKGLSPDIYAGLRFIAKAKSELIENIKDGGTVILNRDDKFFSFLNKKAKLYKLKVSTFGKHSNSDICFKKIINQGGTSKVLININRKMVNFEIKDLNLYNLMASLAVLKELKIDFFKVLLISVTAS